MTGIERLRAIAGVWDELGLGGTLAEIADQIERDFADARMGHVSLMRILEVVTKMERHYLGHEGMEDSPVARWARELRGALKSDASDGSEAQNPSCVDAAETADATSEAKKVTRDPAEDVSMSAYDLLPADERDAIAWVRDHGGLDYVKREWRSRSNLKRMYEKEKAKVERQKRHIEFVQGKCRERQGHIVELSKELAELRKVLSDYRDALGGMCERLGITDGMSLPEMPDVICEALDRRLMPDGYEWPRYESGEPVRIGDDYECWCGETHAVCSVTIREGRSALNESHPHTFVVSNGQFTAHGKRVNRPSVLAADGEPLEVGQTVYNVGSSEERVVDHIEYEGGGTTNVCYADGGWDYPDLITHQRPVLDADGVPIELGDDLYSVEGGLKIHVSNIDRVNCRITTSAMFALDKWADPSMFTHTKPEPPDSWDALWDDIEDCAVGYESFMSRCRVLAERERGE